MTAIVDLIAREITLEELPAQIERMLARNISQAEIAREFECSWSTLHRYIKKHFQP